MCMGGSHVCMGSTWEDHTSAGKVHGQYMGGSRMCRGGVWENHACAGEELARSILYTTIKQRWGVVF